MKSASVHMDVELLPEEARRELLDFYQFLLKRYKVRQPKGKKRLQKLIEEPLHVERINIPPREELYER